MITKDIFFDSTLDIRMFSDAWLVLQLGMVALGRGIEDFVRYKNAKGRKKRAEYMFGVIIASVGAIMLCGAAVCGMVEYALGEQWGE